MMVPTYMQEAAQQGMEWHLADFSEDGTSQDLIDRAEAMAAGEPLTEEQIRELAAWFDRHRSDLDGTDLDPDKPTPQWVAWYMNGGDQTNRAPEWAEEQVERLDQAEEAMSDTDTTEPVDDRTDALPAEIGAGMRDGVFRRHISVRAADIDEQSSTIRLLASTSAPIDMGGWREVLVHSDESIDTEAARAVLMNHDPNQIVGTIRDMYVEDGGLRAVIDLVDGAKASNGADVAELIRCGALRGVSIGYTYERGNVSYDEETRTLTAHRWRLLEITMTPIPADAAAGVRSLPIGDKQPVPPAPKEREAMSDPKNVPEQPGPEKADIETATRDAANKAREEARAEARAIASLARSHDIPADDLMDLGLDGAKDKILEIVAQRAKAPVPAGTVVSKDGGDKFMEHAEDQLMSGRMGILGAFRKCSQFAGRDVYDLDNHELARQILSTVANGMRDAANKSTDGFTNLLANVQNKAVIEGFSSFEGATWARFCSVREVPDFKQVTHTGLASGRLIETPANVAFPELTQADGAYNSQLGLWGATVSLSFQALTNDDLGQFLSELRRAGAIAAHTIDREVYYRLLQATWTNDLTTSAGLNTAGNIDKTRAEFREKLSPAGEKMGHIPRFILVDAANRYNADVATGQLYGVQTGGNSQGGSNPSRQIEVVESVWIGDTGLKTGVATTDYYLVGNPQTVDTVTVSFLRGMRQPVVQMYDAGAVAAEKWKVMLPFDATVATHTDSAGNARVTGIQKATA